MADTRRMTAAKDRGATVTFEFDGQKVVAHEGETVAMALFAAGRTALRRSARIGAPRGVFCNMGICYDCLVYVEREDEDRPRALRSCMVPVVEGLRVGSWRPRPEEPRPEEPQPQ